MTNEVTDRQIYKQREGESDKDFFRRSFLAFANEQFIVAGASKYSRDEILDKLAQDLDKND